MIFAYGHCSDVYQKQQGKIAFQSYRNYVAMCWLIRLLAYLTADKGYGGWPPHFKGINPLLLKP